MIAAKDRVAPLEAHVVAEMSGRMQGAKLPVGSRNLLAIGQSDIRGKARINALSAVEIALACQFLHQGRPSGAGIAEGQHRRAGRVGQNPRERGMIEMRMSDKDVADPFSGCEGGQNGLQVILVGGTRVDHCDLSLPDDIGIGAEMRHRRGVGGEDAPDTRLQHLGCAIGWGIFVATTHLALSLPSCRR